MVTHALGRLLYAETVSSIGHLFGFISAICQCNRTTKVRFSLCHPLYAGVPGAPASPNKRDPPHPVSRRRHRAVPRLLRPRRLLRHAPNHLNSPYRINHPGHQRHDDQHAARDLRRSGLFHINKIFDDTQRTIPEPMQQKWHKLGVTRINCYCCWVCSLKEGLAVRFVKSGTTFSFSPMRSSDRTRSHSREPVYNRSYSPHTAHL